MNKSELIDAIAARSELSKAAAAKALDAVIETIVDSVAQGETVTLVGFGSFKASGRASREGKNPKTGEKIHIPETTVPKFSAGATFKARVAARTNDFPRSMRERLFLESASLSATSAKLPSPSFLLSYRSPSCVFAPPLPPQRLPSCRWLFPPNRPRPPKH
jgi:DNA-binding protein HU-beta